MSLVLYDVTTLYFEAENEDALPFQRKWVARGVGGLHSAGPRDAIEAHLTVVGTNLAVARYHRNTTGHSIGKIIRTLRLAQDVTITFSASTSPPSTRLPQTPEPFSTRGSWNCWNSR